MGVLLFLFSFLLGSFFAFLWHTRTGRALLALVQNLFYFTDATVITNVRELALSDQVKLVAMLPMLGEDGLISSYCIYKREEN